ncbi:WD40 repeat-like protein, partial [Rhizoctonia solani]
MQALNYEDEEMDFEGSSPFNADDDDDEADTQSENSEPEEEPEPEPEQEAGDSGDESDPAEDSDQERASSPPSDHEPEEPSANIFEKRPSPVMVPVMVPAVPIRAASPAALRRAAFKTDISSSVRSYSIDPICAYPHTAATHSLAASKCMTHLLTGSDDGYIRDYDFYAGCNGKVLLTAPQRQHCGLGEGVMKGGVLRMWWENPSGEGGSQPSGGDVTPAPSNVLEGGSLSPVYCMTMHSDALWGLSGTAAGNINLFTVRHDPGRLHFVLRGHKGPTSGLALSADEKKVYSAGWDGHALEWDLNVGQIVRRYPSHGAQLVSIGIRPISSNATDSSSPSVIPSTLPHNQSENFISSNGADGTMGSQRPPTQMGGSPRSAEEDYDPLFDDPELDASADLDQGVGGRGVSSALAWRSAVPTLDSETYERYSHNILMTAGIDGQITIWDRRVAGSTPGSGVGRLEIPEKTPPWCVSACWSADGSQLYAGRRNGTVEVWDMRQTRNTHEGTPRLLRTLRNPLSSGAVSCVVAFPDGKYLACASQDNIRLWNVSAEAQAEATSRSRVAPFKIIAGHHGGTISQICMFLMTFGLWRALMMSAIISDGIFYLFG